MDYDKVGATDLIPVAPYGMVYGTGYARDGYAYAAGYVPAADGYGYDWSAPGVGYAYNGYDDVGNGGCKGEHAMARSTMVSVRESEHDTTSRKLAEASLELAETSRKLAETSLKLAETSRELAETSRKHEDTSRELAETSRELAETSRKHEDTSRELAETKAALDSTEQDYRFRSAALEKLDVSLDNVRCRLRDAEASAKASRKLAHDAEEDAKQSRNLAHRRQQEFKQLKIERGQYDSQYNVLQQQYNRKANDGVKTEIRFVERYIRLLEILSKQSSADRYFFLALRSTFDKGSGVMDMLWKKRKMYKHQDTIQTAIRGFLMFVTDLGHVQPDNFRVALLWAYAGKVEKARGMAKRGLKKKDEKSDWEAVLALLPPTQ